MIRRLFALASTLSLVCCTMTVVLWVGSYLANESIELARHGQVYEIRVARGSLTASNAPQLEMEDVLLKQRRDGRSRAFVRLEDLGERLDELGPPSQFPGEDLVHTFKRVEDRLALRREETDAATAMYCMTRMRWLPVVPPAPWSFSCRCRTIAAVAAMPWLAITVSMTGLRRRLVRRRNHGLCPACGYDLRASKDRCPECGMPITSKQSAILR
jgi:hypothetical protein